MEDLGLITRTQLLIYTPCSIALVVLVLDILLL